MTEAIDPAAPPETGALIDHILDRYHAAHRAELDMLQPLADRVEAVHADDPDVPRGLARVLAMLRAELEGHMAKEETVLFPAMRAGGMPGIGYPVAAMRAEHHDHAAIIGRIRALTADLTPPAHACGSWQRLYAGVGKLLDDLAAHVALENDVLFPRFERG